MTTRQKMETKGVNLNTIIGIVTLLGMLATGVFFISPLRTLPSDMHEVQNQMEDVARTQAVQTEALKTLAEVAKDGREMRRDIDKVAGDVRAHDVALDSIHGRLQKLEK